MESPDVRYQRWEMTTRLRKLERKLRDRYHLRGGELTLAIARAVDKKLRALDHNRASVSKLWWLPTDWNTTVEDALFAAHEQGLTFGAIDTEYVSGTASKITEVGFSRYADGRFHSHHYIVGGGKSRNAKKFKYGRSQYYPLKKFLYEEILSLVQSVDVLLFWQKEADLKMLQTMGLSLPAEKVLDVVHWQRRPHGGYGAYTRYNLRDFCAVQGVTHTGWHNAGNDARVLLEATLLGMGAIGPEIALTEVER